MAKLSLLQAAVRVMKQLFKLLLQKKLYHEASQVAWNVQLARQAGGTDQLMRELLYHPECPELTRARLIRDFLTANPPLVLEHPLDQEKVARDIFMAYEHRTGTIDLDLRQALRKLELESDSAATWKVIQDCCDKLQVLDAKDRLCSAYLDIFQASGSTAHSKFFEVRHASKLSYNAIMLQEDEVVPWVLNSLALLQFWNLQSGHTSKAIETGEAVYTKIKSLGSDCHYILGMIAQNIALFFKRLGNTEKMMEWASICFDYWCELNPEDKAMAEFLMIVAKVDLASSSRMAEADAKALEQSTWDQVQNDKELGLWSVSILKSETILSSLIIKHTYLDHKRWADLIDQLIDHLPEAEQTVKRANIKQRRGLWVLNEKSQPNDISKENEALDLLKAAAQLYHSGGHFFEWANTYRMIGLCYSSIFRKQSTIEPLRQAILSYEKAKNYFHEVNQLSIEIECYCSIAECAYTGWRRGWLETAAVLQTLAQAEILKDRIRDDLSIMNVLDAIAEKQKLRTDSSFEKIYDYAILLSSHENDVVTLWEWVQRSKARSISDMLGLGVLLPRSLLEDTDLDIMNGISAGELYRKEQSLFKELQSTPIHLRMPLRTEISKIQLQMNTYPSLKKIISLRRGEAVTLERLQSKIKIGSNGKTVFVDWFIQGFNIHMVVVLPDSPPICRSCHTSFPEIVHWKSQFWDTPEGFDKSMRIADDEQNPLRQLDKLVQPLERVLPKGSLLIFSPTGVLHNLPLHALWLDDAPVIEDYAVAYASSLTTFIQCRDKAVAKEAFQSSPKSILSIYEPGEQEFSEMEQREIYRSAVELGKEINGDVKIGTEVGQGSLSDALSSSSIMNFHGHCKLNVSMLDQALVLADGNFAAKDFFGLRINVLLATLIACGSATQAINKGDEPLGLISALLCAGAPSVIGSMWPIASGFGREFLKSFYEHAQGCRDGELMNWAAALQEVVKEIKYDYSYRFPVYWASMVLHGSSHCKASANFFDKSP
jgi:CHAT domain-containing protein/tetratricopeptide (TPR) repeat protein